MTLRERTRGILALPSDNLLARFVTMNVLGNGANLLLGFVVSVVLARLLGPSDRGLLALLLAVNSIVLVALAIGLPIAVTYFASLEDADPPAILGNCLLHAAVLAALLIPAAWVLHRPIADALGHGHGGLTWVLVVAALLVPLTFLNWTTSSQLQGTLRFARFNVVMIVSTAIYAICVLILVGVLDLGVVGGLIATAVGSLVMIFGSLHPIVERGRPRIDLGLMRKMFSYGSRAQVGSILQIASGRVDVIIIEIYRPLSQVGYYVVAQAVAQLVLTLAQEFRWTSMVLVTKYEGDARQARTSTDSVRHYGIAASAAVICNAAFGSALILVAYGHQYEPAVGPMLVLLPGMWFLGMSIVIQGDLDGRGRPGLSSRLAALAAGVTVAFDLALIPPFGVIGAAIASVFANSIYGVASVTALRSVSGIPVRELVVPRRDDLASYWRFAMRALRRLV